MSLQHGEVTRYLFIDSCRLASTQPFCLAQVRSLPLYSYTSHDATPGWRYLPGTVTESHQPDPSLFSTRSKAPVMMLQYQTIGLASPAFGVPPLPLPPTTPSGPTFFLIPPFTGGNSNPRLLPPVKAFHLHLPSPGFANCVHVKAPTHGCTFHPTSNVTFPRSARRPDGSEIWYFGFWFLRWMTPGSL